MRRQILLACSTCLIVGVLGGCPAVEQRLINQGGGSIFSAVAKLGGGTMSRLTPDELQILGDTISDLNPDVDIYITDEQAQAGIEFVKANDLQTLDDVFALVEEAQQNPDAVVIPDSLQELADSGISLEDLIQISGVY